MKNWFNNLDNKIKKYIVWGTWIACIVSFIIMGSIPEESWETSIFDDLFAVLFLAFLVFAIIFTVWKVKYKDKPEKKIEETPTKEIKPIIEQINKIIFKHLLKLSLTADISFFV